MAGRFVPAISAGDAGVAQAGEGGGQWGVRGDDRAAERRRDAGRAGRTERNVVMADTYFASHSSKAVGKNRQLLFSKSHFHEDYRILVVDDFSSSCASQEALLRIISDAGAKAVGVGILLQKMYEHMGYFQPSSSSFSFSWCVVSDYFYRCCHLCRSQHISLFRSGPNQLGKASVS